jgi:hypothetical protein
VTEPTVTEPPVTEPPVTGKEGENEGTPLQGIEPENFPRYVLNEIMDLVIDTVLLNHKDMMYYMQSIEMLINKEHKGNFKLIIYNHEKKPFIYNFNYPDSFTLVYPVLSFDIKKEDLRGDRNPRPYLYKTCIVAIMEDEKYVDAVCLIEEESSDWPVGYEHFPEIMEKLYADKVWQSSKGELPGPKDAVVTSSIDSTTKSVNRREGTIYHTAADWYISTSSILKKNNKPLN